MLENGPWPSKPVLAPSTPAAAMDPNDKGHGAGGPRLKNMEVEVQVATID